MPSCRILEKTLHIETVTVLEQQVLGGGYRVLKFASGKIAAQVKPGQFIHLRVAPSSPESPVASAVAQGLWRDKCHREEWRSWLRRVPQRFPAACRGVLHGRHDFVLRRPFSVFKAGKRSLTILYKIIGEGTKILAQLRPGDKASIIGPLGSGFPAPAPKVYPLLVAGGYGSAALYLLAERARKKGAIFMGGKTAEDILCVADFKRLGWNVRIATEDGSAGWKGLVTDAVNNWITDERENEKIELYACGPMGMLETVAGIAMAGGWKAWLSLDRHMGCGVGACLACVQKVRIAGGQSSGGSWKWARICTEGPVFECREIVWD